MDHVDSSATVSAIIPTYNRAELVQAAIESVLAQTIPVHEVIVADDGSTDSTREIVQSLSDRDSRVIFVPAPEKALVSRNRRSAARNRGVVASTGALVAFLDSDDLWKPNRIAAQLESFSRQPDACYAFCNLQVFDELVLLGAPFLDLTKDYNGDLLAQMLNEPLIVSSTLMVRRAALESVGGWSEEVGAIEDYELALRLADKYSAAYTPEVLVLMRQHNSRTSQTHGAEPLTGYLDAVHHFLDTHPALPGNARLQALQGISNVHYKLARYYLGKGRRQSARRHLLAMLKQRPWDRRAVPTYLKSFLP